jgi:hypothetical protein
MAMRSKHSRRTAKQERAKILLFETLMALWNVTSKNRETKVLVSFFLLYIGISCLPALMNVSAFSPHNIVSHADITGRGQHPLRVIPSPSTQNITTIQAHTAVTPTTAGTIGTPTVNTGVTVDTKSQAQIGDQVSAPGTSALFHQVTSPSTLRDLPSITPTVAPTREPEVVATPIRSGTVSPTPTPEAKATATPLPIPTSVIPVVPPVIIPPIVPSPPAGQNVASGGHS